jgi:DNA-3-methyladenine glycosylase
MHHLLNAVTEREGMPAAVLIRALEPLEGIEWMEEARGIRTAHHLLTSGPGKLAQAFGLDLEWNRADLTGSDLWIEPAARVPGRRVGTSARIGCQNVPEPWANIPWRFYDSSSRHVTPGRADRSAPRAAPNLVMTNPRRIGNNRASRAGSPVLTGKRRTRKTPSR